MRRLTSVAPMPRGPATWTGAPHAPPAGRRADATVLTVDIDTKAATASPAGSMATTGPIAPGSPEITAGVDHTPSGDRVLEATRGTDASIHTTTTSPSVPTASRASRPSAVTLTGSDHTWPAARSAYQTEGD